jgi:hypothetical protein
MASEAQMIGYELLKTGTLVSWLEQQKGKKLMQLVGQ